MTSLMEELSTSNPKKIVLLVLDGLGGLPREKGGKTELETARTPNLDALAAAAECGMHLPAGFGITAGSAVSHLALFGYDPLQYPVGRGVISALGIALPMKPNDVAARLDFATLDKDGVISDRRAGRISTETCAELCELLSAISIKGVEVVVRPVRDHRAVVVFRGKGLSELVTDTDPQDVDVMPLEPKATGPEGARMAEVTKEFVVQAHKILSPRLSSNGVLLRGFAKLPRIPSLRELYKLSAAAFAVYPDYKGVARLVGMDVVEDLSDLDEQAQALKDAWSSYDFFFIHHKTPDSKGEDGDFDGKVQEIEKVDAFVPSVLSLKPDLVIVTGDHSTPA
ncbi:MAG TPA: phosphoglycerate mutase, partial [Spirochaetia bacterium]|nr:phosphoglycerate mutase [Spirochaetia bacterium]